jgi:hypothetical protein
MHNRDDRDDYVDILLENIEDKREYHFDKVNPIWFSNFDTPYDYNSVLHYNSEAFSKNGKSTIEPKDKRYKKTIGTFNVMSFGDIVRVNNMYKCYEEGYPTYG